MTETFKRETVNQLISQLESQIAEIKRRMRSDPLSRDEARMFQEGRTEGLHEALDTIYEVFGLDVEAQNEQVNTAQQMECRLAVFRSEYESIVQSEESSNEKDKKLSSVMIRMEHEFTMPLISPNEKWIRENEPVIALYLEVSSFRSGLK